MKNLIYLVVVSFMLFSCGSSGGDTPTPPPPTTVNNAPSVPTLVYPTNNLLCIDNVLDFDWNASTDPDGDAITYQVQVAKDAGFSQLVHTITESSTLRSLSLEKGIAYYWRVKATDSKSLSSSYSSVNQFYTEGEGELNHLPFSPILVAPDLNATIQTTFTTLSWTASDVDNNPLVFDVYFNTVNPPVSKVSENQSEVTFDVSLTASTNYYWKIIVKDDNGGITNGQVWNFKTD